MRNYIIRSSVGAFPYFRKILHRRGSAVVEASLVYPIIIAVSVMFICAAVYIYGLAAAASDMTRSVRRISGSGSGTVCYAGEEDDKGSVYSLRSAETVLGEKAEAEFSGSFRHFYIFRTDEEHSLKAQSLGINEMSYILSRETAEDIYENAAEQAP